MPDEERVRQSRTLQVLGGLLHDSRLWQFNRRAIANAFALGLFAMWIPMPMQMLFVAAVAIPCRANLPLAIALVWITNPITVPLMFFGAYLFGAWVLGHEMQTVEFDTSIDWLTHTLVQIWEPFLLGCGLLGVMSGALGYGFIQITWRFYIHNAILRRRARKASLSS